MRSQEQIRDKLNEFSTRPELDPLSFKRETLFTFASYDTLKSLGKLHIDEDLWEPIKLEREEVVQHLKTMLNLALARSYSHNVISINRIIQKIEMVLWILEDEEAISFINDDDNLASFALPIVRYLSKRYEHDSQSATNWE